ncbi:hypothetical protein [Vitiosangium sp. GDMCC 1.1324]|uniref:hypothetical protein n=1 Tax=Vitiosangium sp. (strain GDMCC 1.1324) TaxID=2138576 RepID=UPI00130E988B|nr:hypothetical protein [Vitiosangium sp. GDMCC 1.1324]
MASTRVRVTRVMAGHETVRGSLGLWGSSLDFDRVEEGPSPHMPNDRACVCGREAFRPWFKGIRIADGHFDQVVISAVELLMKEGLAGQRTSCRRC